MIIILLVAQVSILPHKVDQSAVLECQVTSFSGGTSWSHNGGDSILTQCFSGGVCTDTGSGNYQYTSDSNGINVTIVSLSQSEVGITWTCSHSTFNASYIVPSK